jgi:hypothetical protein
MMRRAFKKTNIFYRELKRIKSAVKLFSKFNKEK